MQEITPLLLLGFLFVANSLWIMGFWLLFTEGMLLGGFDKWAMGWKKGTRLDSIGIEPIHEDGTDVIPRIPAIIRKPLYQCPFCMSSVHGSAWYLIADLGHWYYLPVYCVALCGAIVVMMWGRVE